MNTILERARSPTLISLSPLGQDVLRGVAVITMVLDHINKVFLREQFEVFTYAGRLAFPLFAFLLAYNLTAREVNWRQYLVPLIVAGIAAQLPFVALFQPLLNIMFTLLLGVLVFPLYDLLERAFGKGLGNLAWLLVMIPNLFTDYPLLGAWLVPLGCILVQKKALIYWIPFLVVALTANQFTPVSQMVLMLPILVLGAALIDGKRLGIPRVVWWAFYPFHLFVLVVLERL
ncbi:MAG: hypothetical protein RLZZ156_491 [Deinococcota bacterium]|jgi:hypothetical protein